MSNFRKIIKEKLKKGNNDNDVKNKLIKVLGEINDVIIRNEVNTYELMDIIANLVNNSNTNVAKILQDNHIKYLKLQEDYDKLKQSKDSGEKNKG